MARYTLHGIFASGPTYKVGLMLRLTSQPFNYEHVDLRAELGQVLSQFAGSQWRGDAEWQ
jgi:hypothetical protein